LILGSNRHDETMNQNTIMKLLTFLCYFPTLHGFLVPSTLRHPRRHQLAASSSSSGGVSSTDPILRRIDKWACVKGCGACCKLGPLDSRPDLPTYLTPDELALYTSMIGPDDWCKHFDQEKRLCTIYDTRPTFCVVDPKKYKTMFNVDEDDLNNFCQFCCTEQIADVYGEDSPEMEAFDLVIDGLETEVDL